MALTREKLAQMIDHTELKPNATAERIRELCKEALEYNFGAVCVNSCNVGIAAEELGGSDIAICSVVGFPLGAMITEAKAFEAKAAIRNGATEIDMVMNIGDFKSDKDRSVVEDIRSVVSAADGNTVKVILETGYLSEEEIRRACRLVEDAGAHFVKTSTGFGPRGASIDDVRIMNDTVGGRLGIKAAGGIGTLKDAKSMIEAGATRIGASRGKTILEGFE
ncbi:deoxyribose-phosphate aldolase [Candidatus Thorarchaeota archaeon]|nr:MAG: deoxyribose-phosphate aldolase [Candidatus Thorarchaeota archaeon]